MLFILCMPPIQPTKPTTINPPTQGGVRILPNHPTELPIQTLQPQVQDRFIVGQQPPQIRPDQPQDIEMVGAPNPSIIQIELRDLIRLLVRDHDFTYNANENILRGPNGLTGIPQINGSVFIENTQRGPQGEQTRPFTYFFEYDQATESYKAIADYQRDRPLSHTRLIHALNLVPRNNPQRPDDWRNGFIRRGDNSSNPVTYHLQFDREGNSTIWDSNRNTYTYRLDENGRLVPPQANTDPHIFTPPFIQFGIYPARFQGELRVTPDGQTVDITQGGRSNFEGSVRGSFQRPGDAGFYLFSPGRNGGQPFFFYTGRAGANGAVIPSAHIVRTANGDWAIDQATQGTRISPPPPVTSSLARLRATYHSGRIWRYNGQFRDSEGDAIYVLDDGRIVALEDQSRDPRVYVLAPNTNTWNMIAERNGNSYTDPAIQTAVRGILEARTQLRWTSTRENDPLEYAGRPSNPNMDQLIADILRNPNPRRNGNQFLGEDRDPVNENIEFARNPHVHMRRMSTTICHQQNQNQGGFRLNLTGFDLQRDLRRDLLNPRIQPPLLPPVPNGRPNGE